MAEALQTPMSANDNANISMLSARKNETIDNDTATKPANIIFPFPMRSARIPQGIMRMVAVNAFIMIIVPRPWPSKPKDAR